MNNVFKKVPPNMYSLIRPTGSAFICNPPVMDTDFDHLLLVEDLDVFDDEIKKIGFCCLENDNYPEQPDFISYRHAKHNLIATENPIFYEKFSNATDLAKKLNLLKKEDRVSLFKFILYGELDA